MDDKNMKSPLETLNQIKYVLPNWSEFISFNSQVSL